VGFQKTNEAEVNALQKQLHTAVEEPQKPELLQLEVEL
jgi:hypothetical protein